MGNVVAVQHPGAGKARGWKWAVGLVVVSCAGGPEPAVAPVGSVPARPRPAPTATAEPVASTNAAPADAAPTDATSFSLSPIPPEEEHQPEPSRSSKLAPVRTIRPGCKTTCKNTPCRHVSLDCSALLKVTQTKQLDLGAIELANIGTALRLGNKGSDVVRFDRRGLAVMPVALTPPTTQSSAVSADKGDVVIVAQRGKTGTSYLDGVWTIRCGAKSCRQSSYQEFRDDAKLTGLTKTQRRVLETVRGDRSDALRQEACMMSSSGCSGILGDLYGAGGSGLGAVGAGRATAPPVPERKPVSPSTLNRTGRPKLVVKDGALGFVAPWQDEKKAVYVDENVTSDGAAYSLNGWTRVGRGSIAVVTWEKTHRPAGWKFGYTLGIRFDAKGRVAGPPVRLGGHDSRVSLLGCAAKSCAILLEQYEEVGRKGNTRYVENRAVVKVVELGPVERITEKEAAKERATNMKNPRLSPRG